jgi:hypothetical protein
MVIKIESKDFSLDDKNVKTESSVVISNGHLAKEEVKLFSDQVCNTGMDQTASCQQELKPKPADSCNTEVDMVCIIFSKKKSHKWHVF